jgi:hypothetical protein
MTSPGERISIAPHLTLITERSESGPGAYVRGVEFNGLTGMTGCEDRDWPVLDPAFGLAERLGCDGIWFRHAAGTEFVTQGADSARRCRELTREDLTREDLTREDLTREDLTREDLTANLPPGTTTVTAR